MNWAIFLDRDGVINVDVHHLRDPQQLQLIPRAAEAIQRINARSIPAIVVTNQAAIARGYLTEKQVDAIHQALSALLKPEGAHIDHYYYCPHHPTEGQPPYRIDCECRKPKPGMLLQAAQDLELDLARSYFIGDTVSDMQAGYRAGCHTVLVQTGYGKRVWQEWTEAFKPEFIAADLWGAVDWIFSQA